MVKAARETDAIEAQAETRRVIRFTYTPLAWQEDCNRLLEKYSRLTAWGSIYTGKTDWASFWLFDQVKKWPNTLAWWTAGLNWQLDPMWDKFEANAKIAGARTTRTPYRVARFANGSRVYALTANNVGLLRSYHPDVIVCDEFGTYPQRSVDLLMARSAGARNVLFLSSAERHAGLMKAIEMGKAHVEGRWAERHVTAREAGLITEEEIERLARELTRRVFDRDILGIIPTGEGQVFANVRECAVGDWRRPGTYPSGAPITYEITWDPAKTSDWSFLCVWRGKRLVKAMRWQYEAYPQQVARVAEFAREYNGATVIMDATGPGGVAYDYLSQESARDPDRRFQVLPVVFTAESKAAMVLAVEKAFDHKEFVLIDPEQGYPYDVLVDEALAFERKRSRSGLRYTYEAPDGQHDDGVSNLLLRVAAQVNAPGIDVA